MRLPGYFTLAKNVSKYSDMGYRLGAVIAEKKPIAIGCNTKKSCIMRNRITGGIRYYSTHAEIKAIRNAGIDLVGGCTMYIYRETLSGKPANARPCDKCMRVLKTYRFKEIYYTIDKAPYYKKEKL